MPRSSRNVSWLPGTLLAAAPPHFDRAPQDLETALHVAAAGDEDDDDESESCCRMLIEAGAAVDARTKARRWSSGYPTLNPDRPARVVCRAVHAGPDLHVPATGGGDTAPTGYGQPHLEEKTQGASAPGRRRPKRLPGAPPGGGGFTDAPLSDHQESAGRALAFRCLTRLTSGGALWAQDAESDLLNEEDDDDDSDDESNWPMRLAFGALPTSIPLAQASLFGKPAHGISRCASALPQGRSTNSRRTRQEASSRGQ